MSTGKEFQDIIDDCGLDENVLLSITLQKGIVLLVIENGKSMIGKLLQDFLCPVSGIVSVNFEKFLIENIP